MILNYLIIALGSALGAVYRTSICNFLPTAIFSIPMHVLCINIIGCFTMGILCTILPLYWPSNDYLKQFFFSGFLGGFTAFSSFALEAVILLKEQQYVTIIIYSLLNITLSIAIFFVGARVANYFC